MEGEVPVARHAVEAVERGVLREEGIRGEAAQLRLAHPRQVPPDHVARHERLHGLRLRVGEAQAPAGGLRHPRPHPVVVVEADPIGEGERRRLADVVEEGREGERRRGPGLHEVEPRGQQPRVDEDVPLRVEVGRLRDPLERRHLGEHDGQQPRLAQQVHPPRGPSLHEEAPEFLADALRRDGGGGRGEFPHGREGRRVDGPAEARGEAHGPQHAQAVLGEALARLPHGSHDAPLDVLPAADEVEDLPRVGVLEQRVHGEVPAAGVLPRVAPEGDLVGAAAVGVGPLGAEGGDLDLRAGLRVDLHGPEALAEGDGAREEGRDLVRPRGGRHVVVLGLPPEEAVAHAAPGEKRLESRPSEAAGDVRGGGARVHDPVRLPGGGPALRIRADLLGTGRAGEAADGGRGWLAIGFRLQQRALGGVSNRGSNQAGPILRLGPACSVLCYG